MDALVDMSFHTGLDSPSTTCRLGTGGRPWKSATVPPL